MRVIAADKILADFIAAEGGQIVIMDHNIPLWFHIWSILPYVPRCPQKVCYPLYLIPLWPVIPDSVIPDSVISLSTFLLYHIPFSIITL